MPGNTFPSSLSRFQLVITSSLGSATEEAKESSMSSGSKEVVSLEHIVTSPLFWTKKMGSWAEQPAPKILSPKIQKKREKDRHHRHHFDQGSICFGWQFILLELK